jgi:hypothetical protein
MSVYSPALNFISHFITAHTFQTLPLVYIVKECVRFARFEALSTILMNLSLLGYDALSVGNLLPDILEKLTASIFRV